MGLNRAKRATKRKLVAVGELAPGMTKKFALSNGKYSVEGMLLNYQGTLHAYVNRCPHIGISLDWVDNQFFTIDGRYLCAPITVRPSSRQRGSVSGGRARRRAPQGGLEWRVKRHSYNTLIGMTKIEISQARQKRDNN